MLHGPCSFTRRAAGSESSIVARANTLRANGEPLAIDACARPRCSIDEAPAGSET